MKDEEKKQVSSDPRIGQRFGDYVVEAQVGRGGMGIVFRARHAVSGEVVALKLMAHDLGDNLLLQRSDSSPPYRSDGTEDSHRRRPMLPMRPSQSPVRLSMR